MTAHATYKIPITVSEQCNVTARSQRAELLRASVLHIWDEFPMVHHNNFEAVNRCLCDIIGNDPNPNPNPVAVGSSSVAATSDRFPQ